MNDKDKEAFEKCWKRFEGEYNTEEDYFSHKCESQDIWQAACLHKQKEIEDKLKAEKEKSLKLVEALNTVDKRLDNADVINPGGLVHAMIKTRLADYKKE